MSTKRQLTNHFSADEFVCPCGNCYYSNELELPIDQNMVKTLELLRLSMEEPLIIVSGFRCVHQNRIAGGAAKSDHLTGDAVDIKCSDLDKLADLALTYMSVRYVEMHDGYVHISFGARHRITRFRDLRGLQA